MESLLLLVLFAGVPLGLGLGALKLGAHLKVRADARGDTGALGALVRFLGWGLLVLACCTTACTGYFLTHPLNVH